MQFKYAWKKLSEDGLLKDIKNANSYATYVFSEYDTEEEAVAAVKEVLACGTYLPSELVLIKVLNLSWEDRK